MDRPLLEVKDLATYVFTRHGVVKAVDGVNFSIKRGESVALVGESGSGKTMTCLSLIGLIPRPGARVVGGEALFEGRDLLKMGEEKLREVRGREIAIVLQDPLTCLNPALTIGDQVGESLKLHRGMKGNALRDRTVELLGMVNIPAPEIRRGQYPHELSGGMRQRVCGAVALSCQPSLLIADEPTTSLDVTIQAQYLRLLRELQQQYGVSLLFVTHDFGVVAEMCDRVAVMYAGRIVESGTVCELFDNPRHAYTRGLIGCLPKVEWNGERLVSIGGDPPEPNRLPAGCRFAPRCGDAEDICHREYPSETELNADHRVSCWRVETNG